MGHSMKVVSPRVNTQQPLEVGGKSSTFVFSRGAGLKGLWVTCVGRRRLHLSWGAHDRARYLRFCMIAAASLTKPTCLPMLDRGNHPQLCHKCARADQPDEGDAQQDGGGRAAQGAHGRPEGQQP